MYTHSCTHACTCTYKHTHYILYMMAYTYLDSNTQITSETTLQLDQALDVKLLPPAVVTPSPSTSLAGSAHRACRSGRPCSAYSARRSACWRLSPPRRTLTSMFHLRCKNARFHVPIAVSSSDTIHTANYVKTITTREKINYEINQG